MPSFYNRALSGTDITWNREECLFVPVMIKQQHLESSLHTQCPLLFLIIVRMFSVAPECIFSLLLLV